MNIQEQVGRLNKFWAKRGCLIAQGMDLEVGAGTFHPLTFFKSLDDKPWKVGYVQASRRPADGRYGDNPLRMQRYYQYQVIIKPSPKNIQEIYLESLASLGIKIKSHDIRFVEDDWESPTLGASGLGWEVWLDSLEITQFTYFQQMAGIELKTVPCEITYGLERIAMFIQGKKDVFDLKWSNDTTYGDLHKRDEEEFSKYNFDIANIEALKDAFTKHEKEAKLLLETKLVMPAYEQALKTSHAFNMLDARGAVSATERPTFIGRIRDLAKGCASLYIGNLKEDSK